MNSIKYNHQRFQPSKVVCVGRNYVAHIEELNNEVPAQPVIFLKPNSAIASELRTDSDEAVHYESEISFLIESNKLSAVAFGLDLTKRAAQSKLKAKGLPWERAKAFDGAAIFSQFVAIPDSINNLRLELLINGSIAQQGSVSSMLNSPDALLAEIMTFMSLEDGDVIMTGTPSGVGVVVENSTFVGRIFDDQDLIVEHQWKVIKPLDRKAL